MSRLHLPQLALALLCACADRASSPAPDADVPSPDAGAFDADVAPIDANRPPSEAGFDAATDTAVPGPAASLTLRFERVAGGVDFDVLVALVDAQGAALATEGVELRVSRGSLSAARVDGLALRARVSTAGTGRYRVEANVPGSELAAQREALVFAQVDEAWDQPESVRGLVNTAGWEDGPSVSPDGAWLTVQYLPVPIDCVQGLDPMAASCKARGPVAAPERPGMPGASRVGPDGGIDNGCPSLGVARLPFPVPPNAIYGFRRTADGSFDAPFPIGFAGVDGCVSPFGFAFVRDGSGASQAVYAFDSPFDSDAFADTKSDLFGAQLAPDGLPITLGQAAETNGNRTFTGRVDRLLGAAAGNQGNPFAWFGPNDRVTVFYDDESGDQNLYAISGTGALTQARFDAPITLPAQISAPGVQESQPFFDGQTLYFRRDLALLASDYRGGAFGDAAAWSAPRTILASDGNVPGALLGAGEPSIANVAGHRELYFVFVERAADGTTSLDIGTMRTR